LRNLARPFAFPYHRILSALQFNTTPVRPIQVKLLSFGASSLALFKGGVWFEWVCANCEMQFSRKDRKSNAPPVTRRDRWGTRTSKPKAGPPGPRRHTRQIRSKGKQSCPHDGHNIGPNCRHNLPNSGIGSTCNPHTSRGQFGMAKLTALERQTRLREMLEEQRHLLRKSIAGLAAGDLAEGRVAGSLVSL
jgi:hypothetical protein